MIAAAADETAFTLSFSGEAAAAHSAAFELVEHMARARYVVELRVAGRVTRFGHRTTTVELAGIVYDEEYGPVIEYRLWDEERCEADARVWRVLWMDVEAMHVW